MKVVGNFKGYNFGYWSFVQFLTDLELQASEY